MTSAAPNETCPQDPQRGSLQLLFHLLLLIAGLCAAGAVLHVVDGPRKQANEASATPTSRYAAAARVIEQHMAKVLTLRFDRICTFNGHIAEAGWIRSDVHPCLDRGYVRIWRMAGSTKSGERTQFKVASIGPDSALADVIRYYPDTDSKVFSDGGGSLDQAVPVFEKVAKLLADTFPLTTTDEDGGTNEQ